MLLQRMNIRNEYITGFAVGVGVTALGYYVYKKNQDRVDDFLRKQGIQVPNSSSSRNMDGLTLEELVLEKERIEDLIAEREMASKELVVAQPNA